MSASATVNAPSTSGNHTPVSTEPIFDGDTHLYEGDTLHALVNGQMVLGKPAFWDTLTIAAEAAVSHLQKVTRNSSLLQAEGASYAPVLCNAPAAFGGAPNRKVAGCVDLEIPIPHAAPLVPSSGVHRDGSAQRALV